MYQNNVCIDKFLEKINEELYFDGKISIGETDSRKLELSKQFRGFFQGIHYIDSTVTPIVLETQKFSFLEVVGIPNDSEPVKTKIGEIRTYIGMNVNRGSKEEYSSETIIKVTTALPLIERTIPKFKIKISQKGVFSENNTYNNTGIKYTITPEIPQEIIDKISVNEFKPYENNEVLKFLNNKLV